MQTVILGTRGTSRHQFAGSMWVRMQYMLGLLKLGVDAYWVDRLRRADPDDPYHSLDYRMWRFRRTMEDFGLGHRYCVVVEGGKEYFGLSKAQLRDVIDRAGLLLNISGYLPADCPLADVRRRAFIDVDPGFTQIWARQMDIHIDRHHAFFTVGQNVGGPGFNIPLGDVKWVPIVPPVCLDRWPAVPPNPKHDRFSTIADWRAAQDAMYDDEYYGGKRKEFLKVLRLPQDSGQHFELALCISMHDCEDIELLVGNGWKLDSPGDVAGDPRSYREFVQRSRAEFSVAKAGYVKSNCGWISDRTACYLASGKPALVQSTGFERHLPTGTGLLAFRNLEEALAGVREINANYTNHCRAARQLAEECFDSDVVLARILRHACGDGEVATAAPLAQPVDALPSMAIGGVA
jgi:hypothetical protein